MPPRSNSDAMLDPGSGAPTPSEPRRRGKEGKDKETFGCPFPGCNQVYSRMEYLKRHQRKHQDDRPFQCRDCSKAFARSDVLLRHRRRCHPTPPPPDHASTSPRQTHRSYPGVPVSSSRNEYREESPEATYNGSRKHPRPSSGSSHGGPRPRLEDEEDEDDDRYAESSRFGRHNGMGNGGVFGVNYYGNDTETSSYTPHLLPMFQHQSQHPQQQPNDPNTLEDASVLLSMAYGEKSSGEGHASSNLLGGQTVVPDWETGQQTINMMMEAANAERESQRTASLSDAAAGVVDANAVLPESLGGFLGTLTSAHPSPKPASPFPLSSLISPSIFGLSLPSNGQNDINNDDADNTVMSMMDQLAAYDTPQTRINPNPERPLLRLDHFAMAQRAGSEISRSSRFHIPSERFGGCYQIPHWALPPLRTLSYMANRTFDTVLQHFSFVHMPTFKLIDTAACLAFAICTVGGIRTGSNLIKKGGMDQRLLMQHFLDGPVPPGSTWESMYQNNYTRQGTADDADVAQVEEWQNGSIVRAEKSNMLVKSFSLAQGVLMTEYNVALLQALVLYNAPYFLSQDESERQMANMFLGTIVNITRQIGFFNQELDHFEVEYQIPQEPHTPNELNLYWRRWIQLETRRRTAYLVYHLDTVSALEANIQFILNPTELSHIPLPAPDKIWKAETGEEWFKAVKNYRPMTLDEGMRRIFYLTTYGAFDALHEKSDTKYHNLLNENDLGPFARVAMVLTLLRGIIDIGEGKRDRGDWRDLTDLWVSCSWLKPGHKMLASDGKDLGNITRDSLRERFTMGLQRWREGWDFDPACSSPTGSNFSVSPASDTLRTPQSPKAFNKTTNYCEEALPFYWLAQALLNLLNAAPPNEPGWNQFGGIRYGDMLKSSRTFTRMGEGVASTGVPAVATTGDMGMGFEEFDFSSHGLEGFVF